MDAPRLVQGCHHIALYYLIAYKAQVPEQLVVVSLAVGQTLRAGHTNGQIVLQVNGHN